MIRVLLESFFSLISFCDCCGNVVVPLALRVLCVLLRGGGLISGCDRCSGRLGLASVIVLY